MSDVAKDLLTKLLSTKFVGTLLGCIDIYRVIATASCDLQTVEQFPWEVVANLNSVVTKLKKMSETLKIVNSDSNGNVTGEQTIEVDENEWPHLARHLNDLKLWGGELGFNKNWQFIDLSHIFSKSSSGSDNVSHFVRPSQLFFITS